MPFAPELAVLANLAPLLILGVWSLLLVALARSELTLDLTPGLRASWHLHRPLALLGALFAFAAALAALADPQRPALLRLTGGLRVDPLADLAALVLLGALLVALLLDPGGPRRGPHVALYCLITAALLLVVHAGALLPLVAGLEIAALGLGALLAVDPRSRRAAWSWLFGQAIISGLLLFGVALLFGATGTTDLSELGGRVSAVFTRWGASPAQAAVDLLQSGVPIPPQLAEQARTRAVTAMAPAALFIPGLLLTFAGLLARLGVAPFARAALSVAEGAPRPVALLIEPALRFAALIALVRLFVGVFHVPRQLHAPYGWSTAAALLAGLTLLTSAHAALRQRELRGLLAATATALAGWFLLGITAAANFFAHAGAYGGRALTVVDHHEWGLQSGQHVLSALLTLAVAHALAVLGLHAALGAGGEPPPGSGALALRGLVRRDPWLGLTVAALILALLGAPPTLLFVARLDLLAVLLLDTNLVLRLLTALALLGALPLALAWLRHLHALFDPDPRASPLADPRASPLAEPAPHARPLRPLALLCALLLLFFGIYPSALHHHTDRAAAALHAREAP
jgi:NADH-quinone oxidoreductase subunit N